MSKLFTGTFNDNRNGRVLFMVFYADSKALAWDHATHCAQSEGYVATAVKMTPGADTRTAGEFRQARAA